eukprot:351347-Chlamydomonas_euryale.AAC.5
MERVACRVRCMERVEWSTRHAELGAWTSGYDVRCMDSRVYAESARKVPPTNADDGEPRMELCAWWHVAHGMQQPRLMAEYGGAQLKSQYTMQCVNVIHDGQLCARGRMALLRSSVAV